MEHQAEGKETTLNNIFTREFVVATIADSPLELKDDASAEPDSTGCIAWCMALSCTKTLGNTCAEYTNQLKWVARIFVGGFTSLLFFTDSVSSAYYTPPAAFIANPQFVPEQHVSDCDPLTGDCITRIIPKHLTFDDQAKVDLANDANKIYLLLLFAASCASLWLINRKATNKTSAKFLLTNTAALITFFIMFIVPAMFPELFSKLIGAEEEMDVTTAASAILMFVYNLTLSVYFLYASEKEIISAYRSKQGDVAKITKNPVAAFFVSLIKMATNPTAALVLLSTAPLVVVAFDNPFSPLVLGLIATCTLLNSSALNLGGASLTVNQSGVTWRICKKFGRKTLPTHHPHALIGREAAAYRNASRRTKLSMILRRRLLALKKRINTQQSDGNELVAEICDAYDRQNSTGSVPASANAILKKLYEDRTLDHVGLSCASSNFGKAAQRFVTSLYPMLSHLLLQGMNFGGMLGYNDYGAEGGIEATNELLKSDLDSHSTLWKTLSLSAYGLPFYILSCILMFEVVKEITTFTFTGDPIYFGEVRGWKRHLLTLKLLLDAGFTVGTTQILNACFFHSVGWDDYNDFSKPQAILAFMCVLVATAIFNGYGMLQAFMINAQESAIKLFQKRDTLSADKKAQTDGAVALTMMDTVMGMIDDLSDTQFFQLHLMFVGAAIGDLKETPETGTHLMLTPVEAASAGCALPTEPINERAADIIEAKFESVAAAAGGGGAGLSHVAVDMEGDGTETAELGTPLLAGAGEGETKAAHDAALDLAKQPIPNDPVEVAGEPIGVVKWGCDNLKSGAHSIKNLVMVPVGFFCCCNSRKSQAATGATDTSAYKPPSMEMTTAVSGSSTGRSSPGAG